MSNERCMCGAIDCPECGPAQGYCYPFEDLDDPDDFEDDEEEEEEDAE